MRTTDIIKEGLVFLISNFFNNKTSLANKWMRKKIPSCSNSALVGPLVLKQNEFNLMDFQISRDLLIFHITETVFSDGNVLRSVLAKNHGLDYNVM